MTDNPIYRAAWIADPHGTLDCRHCGRELGNGHTSDCPVAPFDFVSDRPEMSERLTPAEVEAGWQIVDGQKYVPATEAAQLREALRRYGTHRAECARNTEPPRRGPCDCGWDAALGDTPDKCPICGLPTTAGPYQCMGHLGDITDEREFDQTIPDREFIGPGDTPDE